jgi:hypothetical protein
MSQRAALNERRRGKMANEIEVPGFILMEDGSFVSAAEGRIREINGEAVLTLGAKTYRIGKHASGKDVWVSVLTVVDGGGQDGRDG